MSIESSLIKMVKAAASLKEEAGRIKAMASNDLVVDDYYPLAMALRKKVMKDMASSECSGDYKADLAQLIYAIDLCKRYW